MFNCLSFFFVKSVHSWLMVIAEVRTFATSFESSLLMFQYQLATSAIKLITKYGKWKTPLS